MNEPFKIEVDKLEYTVNPYNDADNVLYEIYTSCEKLFTLKRGSDGIFKTYESGIIPINTDIIENIGDAINLHLSF